MTTVANKQTDNNNLLLNIQVENHGYCMAIMQVVVVGCLGVRETPGRSAVKPRKESPKAVLSRRGLFTARAKWSFSQCQNIMKMTPTERAQRNEDVGFGFT